jgi:hypothetical protein
MLAQAGGDLGLSAGVVGVIATIIAVAGAKGVWVWGHMHRDAMARADRERERAEIRAREWQTLAERLAGVTETAASKAADVVYEAARQSEERRI